jgi:Carboxypeptidase regulatory-like domain
MKLRLRLLLVAMAFLVGVCAALGQDAKHEAQLRTVRGVVADKSSDTPVPSAVVFLKNTRTNAVRSYIADDEGNYRFSGLDPNVDYEIHAEKDGAKSTTRTVSSFDNKKEIILNLKIERKKA